MQPSHEVEDAATQVIKGVTPVMESKPSFLDTLRKRQVMDYEMMTSAQVGKVCDYSPQRAPGEDLE
jgi:hypothetical protein